MGLLPAALSASIKSLAQAAQCAAAVGPIPAAPASSRASLVLRSIPMTMALARLQAVLDAAPPASLQRWNEFFQQPAEVTGLQDSSKLAAFGPCRLFAPKLAEQLPVFLPPWPRDRRRP